MSRDYLSILHVYRTYYPDPPGGLQEAIRQTCLAVQPFGIENTVFTLSPKPEPTEVERPEARVVRSRSWAAPASCDLGGFQAFGRFRTLARAADVIHYHFPWPFADVLHEGIGAVRPSVLTYHSDVVRQQVLGKIYRPLMMRMLGSMSSVVATSPAYARTSAILAAEGIRERVRTIPLGIEESSYPKSGDANILSKLGVGPGEPFFLFVGVLRYYKGLHHLVRAAGNVNAKIVIAGSGPEGKALRELAESIQARNVLFAGQVSDEEKVALLQHCHALVLPSHLRSEAFGMVLVEAAMYGKPMISCEIGTGTSFVNEHGVTGFVVAPEEPRALADSMNGLLVDSALSGRMGEAARRRYEELFSGKALGRQYAALYEELAGRAA